MVIRSLLAAAVLAAASLAAAAVPAVASVPARVVLAPPVHTPFAVTVNGGTDVTFQHLTAGQEVYHGGIAYKVVTVSGHAVVFAPRWSAPDGTTAVFST